MLPGPSLPEFARTVLARAAVAEVGVPSDAASMAAVSRVPVRAGRDGSPLLLPAPGSLLERRLEANPGTVTVTVPAGSPFRGLRLAGLARPLARYRGGTTVCTVDVRLVELTGGSRVLVPVDEYRAAAPDPLWRVAPGVLRHLEQAHAADLVACVRAHGMTAAECVIPRGLDRYGLEFRVLTAGGVAAVRLSFPAGPVASLDGVPTSIRTTLTCRCQEPGQ